MHISSVRNLAVCIGVNMAFYMHSNRTIAQNSDAKNGKSESQKVKAKMVVFITNVDYDQQPHSVNNDLSSTRFYSIFLSSSSSSLRNVLNIFVCRKAQTSKAKTKKKGMMQKPMHSAILFLEFRLRIRIWQNVEMVHTKNRNKFIRSMCLYTV